MRHCTRATFSNAQNLLSGFPGFGAFKEGRTSSGKKKAHKHKPFCPVNLGTTPGLSLGQTQVFSLFYPVEAQFVPGTTPVCPWDKPGSKGGRITVYVPFSLATIVTKIDTGRMTYFKELILYFHDLSGVIRANRFARFARIG